MSTPNTLLISDTLYEITDAYRQGATAMRAETTWYANPYPNGTDKHDQWDWGHTHESENMHVINDVDIITAPPRPAQNSVTRRQHDPYLFQQLRQLGPR